MPPPYFLVAGPTASGKSEFAVALAERINGVVLCADAFQVYAGMEVLTAAPGASLRERVPHRLYGVVSPDQSFNVGQYLALLQSELATARENGLVPIVTGGTGLYFRALVQGLSDLPKADPVLRSKLESLDAAQLIEKLKALDPTGCESIDLQNPRRVLRAVEICLLTGKPASLLRTKHAPEMFDWPGICLDNRAGTFAERILTRTRAMLQNGALEEVTALRDHIGPSASQAIGFGEIQALLDGQITQEKAIEKIALSTRQYAKRQRTWFRNQTRLQWLSGDEEHIASAMEVALRLLEK